jgi:hypothetical protein
VVVEEEALVVVLEAEEVVVVVVAAVATEVCNSSVLFYSTANAGNMAGSIKINNPLRLK